ncbi:hypothetical protein ABPG72_014774 [Tetrahymena utriculariae]
MDYNFSGSPQPIQFNQGKQYKEMFPRLQAPKKPKTPEEQLQKRQPKGPGIFFDMQKGLQYQKIENTKKILQRAQSQTQIGSSQQLSSLQATAAAAITSQGGLVHFGEKNSQKLYSPYEYLHYATKINFSKENYLNSLQQLGFQNVNNLNEKPYNDIMNKTQNIIAKSYSLKYLGVIDGNMGILSKRVKISEDPRAPSQDIKKKQKSKRQMNNMKKFQNENIPANISLIPSTHRPDLYNSYLITQYSLPKYLKPIIKEKDSTIIEEKQRIEKWNIEQLKKNSNFFQNESINNTEDIQYGNNNSTSMSMNATYIGKIKPRKLQNNNRQPSPQQKNESLIKHYAEVPEESLCYAIIDKSNEAPINLSYSRLINTISKGSIEKQNNQITQDKQIIPQGIKTTKDYFYNSTNEQIKTSKIQNLANYNTNSQFKFTQNKQLQDRFDHIAQYLVQKKKI